MNEIEITAKDIQEFVEQIELSANIPENEIEVDDEITEAWELTHIED